MRNEIAIQEIESIDYFLQNHTNDYSESTHTALMMAKEALKEQKVGKWNLYRCSECKRVCSDFIRGTYWIIRKPNYCPNCGAKMKGAENDSKGT